MDNYTYGYAFHGEVGTVHIFDLAVNTNGLAKPLCGRRRYDYTPGFANEEPRCRQCLSIKARREVQP